MARPAEAAAQIETFRNLLFHSPTTFKSKLGRALHAQKESESDRLMIDYYKTQHSDIIEPLRLWFQTSPKSKVAELHVRKS